MPTAKVGATYSTALSAEGGVKPYHWSLASGTLPPGVKLDRRTGALSGVPAQTGSFDFAVQVSDSTEPKPAIAMRGLSLVVTRHPPQITTSALPNAQAGTPFQASLSAAGGVQPYHWSIAAGPLPSRLLLNADAGVLLGTPSESGQFDFTVQVSDSSHPKPQTAMKALTLSIVALALQITSGGLPGGQVGVPFQAFVSASGGVPPYTWAVVGVLPSGLSLNASSGAVVGTPTQSGASTFFVQVNDSIGQTAQKSFSITIAAASTQPLAISTTALPQPVIQQAYSQTLQATGGTPPYTWSVASGQLPVGLTLAATGQIAGAPTAAGQSSFTVQVADSASPPLTASKVFSLTLTDSSIPSALDQYGGDANHPCAGTTKNGSAIPGATGFFYLYKDTNLKRWMFCDPLGNRFFMQDVELINGDYSGGHGASNKYGTGANDYYTAQVARLQSLGFNTIGEYASLYMLPVPTYFNSGNPSKMPFKLIVRPLAYAPTKPLVPLLPPAYTSWRGSAFQDVFDPAFTTYVTSLFVGANETIGFVSDGNTLAALDASPWLVGVTVDDADQFWGMKNSGGIDLGWMVGLSTPYMASVNTSVLTDTTFYLKQQFKSYLTTKYGTVAALNAAWGSNYTNFGSTATTVTGETIGTGDGVTTTFNHTFAHTAVDPASLGISVGGVLQAGDCPWFNLTWNQGCSSVGSGNGLIKAASGNISGGTVMYASGNITVTFSLPPSVGVAITGTYQYSGWPKATAGGTGLLDEDGTSSWYPPCCGFPNPPVGTVATDLHGFYTPVAQQYFSTVTARIRAALPHHLIFSVNAIDLPNQPEVLTQAAQYVDAVSVYNGVQPNVAGNQAVATAAYNTMGIPIIPFFLLVANEDSSFFNMSNPFTHCRDGWGADCYHTQQARGQAYQSYGQQWVSSYVGADGYGFIAGWDWWAHVDKNNEQQNFGLITLNDNLYDGLECTTTNRVDRWGHVTTPEMRNFGDFISSVKVTNRIWLGLP